MIARATSPIIGKWRIISSDMWDRDFLDLVEPAYIVFSPQGGGEFVFGAVTGSMDCRYGGNTAFFTWIGSDEMDEVSGSGEAELDDDDTLTIDLHRHLGDEAILVAKKW
ncbi:hypothetical protein HGD85_02395 [Rhodobacteraceae bacterium R_SAG10]|nr:hypothetical protein [Rhodobacteraceae bacterium R_SAG10]